MSIAKDVVVNIKRLTAGLQVPGFGLPLLVTTTANIPYKEYSDISGVLLDFASTTSAYKMALAVFSQEPKVEKVAIVGIEYNTDFSEVIDGLGLVAAAYNDWYFIACDIHTQDAIAGLSGFATANKKMYFTSILPSDVGVFVIPSSDRMAVMVHDKPEQYSECAWIGNCSTFAPGSATWKFKALNGIAPVVYADQGTEVDELDDLYLNTYVTKYGLNMTTGGYVSSGEYIDIMLSVDWIQQDMETRIMRLLVTNPKVPYTNEGIALIASQVEATLRTATAMGIFRTDASGVGEYNIVIPDITAINPNDIALRVFKDLTWSASLAGAIHEVEINGVVQY